MTPTMKDLGIDQLNAEQRVALALEIWESLGDARSVGRLNAEQRTHRTRPNRETALGLLATDLLAGRLNNVSFSPVNIEYN